MRFKTKLVVFVGCLLFFIFILPVKAESPSGDTTVSNNSETSTEKSAVVTNPARGRNLQEKRQNLQEKIDQEKMKFKEMMEMKRKEASESFKLKRDEFKQKLELIKDERKKTIVSRINNRLSEINKNRTDRMMEALNKLNELLKRISQKVDEAKSNGVNTTAVELAIDQANKQISSAQTAVSNQAGKVYVAQINDETKLKSTVGQTVSQLENDLMSLHKIVLDAKQAVYNAALAAKKVKEIIIP